MAAKNITEQLLRFLSSFGVGYNTDISELVKRAFPIQEDDLTDDIYNSRVRHYLDNLERLNYIKCHKTIVSLKSIYIEAAILDAGAKHLITTERSKLSKTVEFLFWLAGIGVLLFMIYEHYNPQKQKEIIKPDQTTHFKDTSALKKHN